MCENDRNRTLHNEQESLPIKLNSNTHFGAHWVASKDIKMGEVIFEEQSLLFGPWLGRKDNFYHVCLGCCNFITTTPVYHCSTCGWPVCNSTCEKKPAHFEHECRIFAPIQRMINTSIAAKETYHRITVLRCLLLSKSIKEREIEMKAMASPSESTVCRFNSGQVSSQLSQLQSNHITMRSYLEDRDRSSRARLDRVIDFIRRTCKLAHYSRAEIKFADELIQFYGLHFDDSEAIITSTLCGFGCRSAVALCKKGSQLLHDCAPNSRPTIVREGSMTLHATSDIKVGQPITITYTETYFLPGMRRAELYCKHFFNCECPRCTEPTEFETLCSAIKCENCDHGYCVQKTTPEFETVYICNQNKPGCQEIPSKKVLRMISTVRRQVSQALYFCKPNEPMNSMVSLETLLKEHSGITLHPNHDMLTNLKLQLSQILFELCVRKQQESRVLLLAFCKRGAQITRECYLAINKVVPGWNKCRGLLLYQWAHFTFQLSNISSDLLNKGNMAAAKKFFAEIHQQRLCYENSVANLGNFEKLFFCLSKTAGHTFFMCPHDYRIETPIPWLLALAKTDPEAAAIAAGQDHIVAFVLDLNKTP